MARLDTDAIHREVAGCKTLDGLYAYCTKELPQAFGCQVASLFTLEQDDLEIRRLVLRKTSTQWNAPAGKQPIEDVSFYDLADDADSLTVWVARHGRTLRLHNLGDPAKRTCELRKYIPTPQWKNKFQDSADHRSFVAAPIRTSPNGPVIGVLRFVQRPAAAGGPEFTSRDEEFLSRLAAGPIGAQLERLRDAGFSSTVREHLAAVNAISAAESFVNCDLGTATSTALTTFFPEQGERRKLYVLNLLRSNGPNRKFIHLLIDSKLKNEVADPRRVYDLDGRSLTEAALKYDRVLFLIDMELAKAAGWLNQIVPAAKSALACRIRFRGTDYGSLVVMSDRFNLHPRVHGPILRVLADQAGEVLAHKEADYF